MPRPEPAPPDHEPEGFLVDVGQATRLHFLDSGAPPASTAPGVLLLHGLAGTALAWAPVARRLRPDAHVIAMDLRGHGLSDAPPDGYDPTSQAEDALVVAEAAGLLGGPLVLAGHGFGGLVAASLAARLGPACGGLVLVDGGWENAGAATGLEPAELLRSLDEPPEVLRSLTAYLVDRRDFDPATWDADQERAARAAVVELPAGRVVQVARPHVLAACVDAMYAYDPVAVLRAVAAPVVALVAADDEQGTRRRLLAEVEAARAAVGQAAIAVTDLGGHAHNLMRYRPDAVASVIASAADRAAAYHPAS